MNIILKLVINILADIRRLKFLDRQGFPVERIARRPVQNALRLLLHTRSVTFALAVVATLTLAACGTLSRVTPHLSFGATPFGMALCPLVKAQANMTIANQAICRNPATIAFCIAAQVAADQAVMLACGPGATTPAIPQLGVSGTAMIAEESAPTAPVDPRIALQQVYESIGMTPMQAARKAMDLTRVMRQP